MLIDENFYELVIRETNHYAEEAFLSGGMLPASRMSRWHDLTLEELRVFLGVFIHMGTIPLSRLNDYWKTSRLFSIPFFSKAISRDRFLLIMR